MMQNVDILIDLSPNKVLRKQSSWDTDWITMECDFDENWNGDDKL